MAIELCGPGNMRAHSLIACGAVDKTSDWSISADEENALLGAGDWTAYEGWHLAENSATPEQTKARYEYPFGKGGKLYRSALVAIRQRAAQNGADAVYNAAGTLLALVDKEKAAEPAPGINARAPISARRVAPVRAKAANDVGEMYIYEEIGDSLWGGITAQAFADALKGLGSVKSLNIYINSPGGNVFEGLAIFNQIRRFSGKKTAYVDGVAASISSIIPLACDEVKMAPNAMMMIHDPWTMAIGTSEDLRKAADSMDKVRSVLLDTYVAKTKGDSKKISQQMNDETWLTAAECIKQGFADGLTEESTVQAQAMAFTLLAKYRHTPNNLRQTAVATASLVAQMDKDVLQLRRGPARTA
jgi:ATP-dependent Clp protease protease subunit